MIWKYKKKIWSKQKNKKNSNFEKKCFWNAKINTEFYETQLKKHVKIASQILRFKLNFLVSLTI